MWRSAQLWQNYGPNRTLRMWFYDGRCHIAAILSCHNIGWSWSSPGLGPYGALGCFLCMPWAWREGSGPLPPSLYHTRSSVASWMEGIYLKSSGNGLWIASPPSLTCYYFPFPWTAAPSWRYRHGAPLRRPRPCIKFRKKILAELQDSCRALPVVYFCSLKLSKGEYTWRVYYVLHVFFLFLLWCNDSFQLSLQVRTKKNL